AAAHAGPVAVAAADARSAIAVAAAHAGPVAVAAADARSAVALAAAHARSVAVAAAHARPLGAYLPPAPDHRPSHPAPVGLRVTDHPARRAKRSGGRDPPHDRREDERARPRR